MEIQEPESHENYKLQAILRETLPYVFVWRSHKTKQEVDRLRNKLINLQVGIVNKLIVTITLEEIRNKEVERKWLMVIIVKYA